MARYVARPAGGRRRAQRTERKGPRAEALYVAKFANKPLTSLRRADVLAWVRELRSTHVDAEGQRVGWARKKAAEDKANGKAPKRRKRRRGGPP